MKISGQRKGTTLALVDQPDRRPAVRIFGDGDDGFPFARARFRDHGMDFEIRGWTLEEWSAIPDGRRPFGAFRLGTMMLLCLEVPAP